MIFPRYHQRQAVHMARGCSAHRKGRDITIWSSIPPAAARATRSAGWPTVSRRCTTRRSNASSTASSWLPIALFSISSLQDTIYQFEHRQGVVQKIDEHSKQLAEALENAVPIIITTLQKFPFVSRQLLKLAEERGEKGTRHSAHPQMRGHRGRGAQLAIRRNGHGPEGSPRRRAVAARRQRERRRKKG